MPFDPAGPVDEFAKNPVARMRLPPVPQETDTSTEGLGEAVMRQTGVGMLAQGLGVTGIDYASGGVEAPSKYHAPAPNFDPVANIPKGYEDYGKNFLRAESPADVETIRQRIDQEVQDKRTIANAGGWGVAATLAGGFVDPINLAMMAVIPEAGATRFANAARWAVLNAGTTAAQEALAHGFSETHTMGESALNIGGAAVLGGLLGPLARRVPSSELEMLRAGLETHEGGLGPAVRTILSDDRLRPPQPIQGEASLIAQELRAAAGKREAGLRTIIEGEEGQRVANLEPDVVESSLRSWTQKRDAIAKELIEEKSAQTAAEAERLKAGPGVLESIRKRYAMTDVEDIVQGRAAKIVDERRADLQEELAAANEAVARHKADAELLAKVEGARIDLEQHQLIAGRAATEGVHTLAEALPEAQRAAFERRIAELPVPEFKPVGAAEELDRLPTTDIGLPEVPINPNMESTVGAAAVAKTAEDTTLSRGARSLSAGPGRIAPKGRMLNSPFQSVRDLVFDMLNVPETTLANEALRRSPDPVERKLWLTPQKLFQQGVDGVRDLFNDYKARLSQESAKSGQPITGRLSRAEFETEVVKAMRRGDVHDIPEVQGAAQHMRDKVFNPYFERAKTLGILPEEATLYAKSYMMRQYDAGLIRANSNDFRNRLEEYWIKQGMDPAEAKDASWSAFRNIVARERDTMDWKAFEGIVPESGRFKERTLAVPDEILEPYLNNNMRDLSHSYLRSIAPEVEFTEKFGSRDMVDQLQLVKDEAAIHIEKARAAGNDQLAAELNDRLTADLTDIKGVRDRLYGVYGRPADPSAWWIRAGRLLRENNVWRLLGGATLSHIPDLANVITKYGLPNTFAAIAKLATSTDAIKMASEQAHNMGVALDMAMNTAQVLGDWGSHSQFALEKWAQRIARGTTIVTGETPLISVIQGLASTVGSNEILRTAEKVAAGEAVSKSLLTKYAASGLDDAMLRRIAAESATHSKDLRGLRFGMSDQWGDKAAAQAFESAVIRDAHSVTLRPGAGDTPLLMSTELGKSVMQFKNFAFAANNTVINPLAQGLARGDPRAMMGVMALAGAGYLSYASKQIAAGMPVETDSNRLPLEILDKSNLLGWTGEAIYPALHQFGFRDLARWSDRDIVESLLGPSIGTAVSTLTRQLPAKIFHDEEDIGQKGFNRADLHFLRRTFMPGQNLWYARRAINDLEDHIGDTFDLPGTSQAERGAAGSAWNVQ